MRMVVNFHETSPTAWLAERKKNRKLKCYVFKAQKHEKNIFIFSFNNLVSSSTHTQSPSLSLAWHVNLINFTSSFELFVRLCPTNGILNRGSWLERDRD